jgi:hypothetical protein
MEMFSVGAALRLLWENPWERVEFRGVRVEIDLIEGRRTAQIVGMRLSADSARRGEEVSAFVRLRPHQSPEETEREVRFRVPHLTPVGGRVGVIACDAAASASISRALAPGRYRPRSLAQLIRIVEEFPTGDELVVRMSKPGQGVTLEGAAMPDLPDSARDILTGAARTGYEMMSDDVVQRQSTPWILTGSATLWIKVKGDEEP